MFAVEWAASSRWSLLADARGVAASRPGSPGWFLLALLTVLFSTFAESLAEGRARPGRNLAQIRTEVLPSASKSGVRQCTETVRANELRKGDHILAEPKDIIAATASVAGRHS